MSSRDYRQSLASDFDWRMDLKELIDTSCIEDDCLSEVEMLEFFSMPPSLQDQTIIIRKELRQAFEWR